MKNDVLNIYTVTVNTVLQPFLVCDKIVQIASAIIYIKNTILVFYKLHQAGFWVLRTDVLT